MVGMVGGSSGQQQSMLSPIAEFPGNEDASPSCPSVPPLLHYRSNSDLRGRAEEIVNPLDLREEPFVLADVMESTMNTLSEATVVYPKQTILCQLNPVSLAK